MADTQPTTVGLPVDWPVQLHKLFLARYGQWVRSLGWDVRDCYQDVCLRILVAQQNNPYNPEKAKLSTYLLWAARNTIINQLSKRRLKEDRCTDEQLDDAAPLTEPEESLEQDFLRYLQRHCSDSGIEEQYLLHYVDQILTGQLDALPLSLQRLANLFLQDYLQGNQ